MDFFNKLGKKASETYQATKEKAANLSEELKLKGKIGDLKDKITSQYSVIGKKVYEITKDGSNNLNEEVIAMCNDITKWSEEISNLEHDILAIKKVKKCVNCGAELESNAAFCSKCGKEQPVKSDKKVEEVVAENVEEKVEEKTEEKPEEKQEESAENSEN